MVHPNVAGFSPTDVRGLIEKTGYDLAYRILKSEN